MGMMGVDLKVICEMSAKHTTRILLRKTGRNLGLAGIIALAGCAAPGIASGARYSSETINGSLPRVEVTIDDSLDKERALVWAKGYIEEVQRAHRKVSDYLGMTFNGTYRLDIRESYKGAQISGQSGNIKFPARYYKSQPVVHEVTHVVAPNYNRFLSEGLAVYLQDKFSRDSVYPTFGIPLHPSVLISVEIPLERLIRETNDSTYYFGSIAKTHTPEGKSAYLHAGYFVKFLIENDAFGDDENTRLDKFIKLYNLADKHYGANMFKKVYGKSLTELEK